MAYEDHEGIYEALVKLIKVQKVIITQPQYKIIWHRGIGNVSDDVVKYSLPHTERIKEMDIKTKEGVLVSYRVGKDTSSLYPRNKYGSC